MSWNVEKSSNHCESGRTKLEHWGGAAWCVQLAVVAMGLRNVLSARLKCTYSQFRCCLPACNKLQWRLTTFQVKKTNDWLQPTEVHNKCVSVFISKLLFLLDHLFPLDHRTLSCLPWKYCLFVFLKAAPASSPDLNVTQAQPLFFCKSDPLLGSSIFFSQNGLKNSVSWFEVIS